MTPEQVNKIIDERLSSFIRSDRFTFEKLLQILDGRSIHTGRNVGSSFGTATDQKVGFHGSRVIQASAISAPTTPSATYSQAEAQSMETAVNSIRTVLSDKGLTA